MRNLTLIKGLRPAIVFVCCDVDGNGTVNFADVKALMDAVGTNRASDTDVNGDGSVNVADAITILSIIAAGK